VDAPPTTHPQVLDRPFGRQLEEFQPGDRYRHWPGRTITEAENQLFCLLTMSHNPVHLDRIVAAGQGHERCTLLGCLVHAVVVGMTVADLSGAAIAALDTEQLRFPAPSHVGDTLYATSRVTSVRPTSDGRRGVVTIDTKGVNQHGVVVCELRRSLLVWSEAEAPDRQVPYCIDQVWTEDGGR
jgi:acyl dehydratase